MVSKKQKEAARLVGLANRQHGMSYTPEYRTWIAMRARCRDLKNPRYGGRGIKVCKRWQKFESFFKDMGLRPKGKLHEWTIERKDNNKNYSPNNCFWATIQQQEKNRNVKLLRKNGRKIMIVTNHIRWHVRRGLKNPKCKLCRGTK